MYADIAIPKTGFNTFTYKVPDKLAQSLAVGAPVMVPLQNHSAIGVVTKLSQNCPAVNIRYKEISALIDKAFRLSPENFKLINWIAEYYVCPVGDVLKAAYPPGFLGRTRMRVLAGDKTPSEKRKRFVFEKIKSKDQGYPFAKSKNIISGISNSLILGMIKEGYLYLAADFKEHRPQFHQHVYLKEGFDIEAVSGKLTKRRRELIDQLLSHPEGLDLVELKSRGFSKSLVDSLAEQGHLEIENKSSDFVIQPSKKSGSAITLNEDQNAAAIAISESLQQRNGQSFLLYGITGSGKTQVYIEAAKQALALGGSVLILLPEISLTPQAIARFSEALSEPIGLWHSRITMGQRYEIYRKVKAGELRVILGVRSAVFSPLQNLGLIIVDEEQDDSYKQSEPPPRYNARDVALMRGKIESAAVVLGSATPSLESFYNAENGKYQLLTLPKRFGGGKLPKAFAIDLKAVEIEHKMWPLSDEFIERICNHIADGKQVIILLNRRGYSGILMCKACGWVALCPDCRVAMTYHKSEHNLKCHFCGITQPAIDTCPQCQNTDFDFRGIGTQKLEELLVEILGKKGILRMDSDSTSRKGALEKIISTFEIGETPLLLGTRMVAKGHHFPQVGMVGVVLADAGLHLPDFRASEKVFQLLVQAAGRAGRTGDDEGRGEFVVQSYDPDSGILDYATSQNYEVFYRREIAYRQELGYPPYGKIIRLIFSGEDDSLTRWAARKASRLLRLEFKGGKVLGPATTGIYRMGNKYHYQVMLKGRFSADFKSGLKNHLINADFGQNKGIEVRVDVDPREML